MRYRVLIEPDEDGVYVAEVPSLPGCITQGATREEALGNVREAIGAYLDSLEAHGDPVRPLGRRDPAPPLPGSAGFVKLHS